MLAGNDLLDKLRELKNASLIERIRGCGYTKNNANDNSEEFNIEGFYEAIIAAKSIKLEDYKGGNSSRPDLIDGQLNFVLYTAWDDLDLSGIDDFERAVDPIHGLDLSMFIESIEKNEQRLITKTTQIHLKASFWVDGPNPISFCETISSSHGASLVYNFQNNVIPFFSTLKASFLMKADASFLHTLIANYEIYRFIEEGSIAQYYARLSQKGQELEEKFFNGFINENTTLDYIWPDNASFSMFEHEYLSEYYLNHIRTISLRSIIDSLNGKLCVNDFQLQSSILTWTVTDEMKAKCDSDEIYDSYIVAKEKTIDSAALLSFIVFADPITRRSIAFHPDSSKAVMDALASDESNIVRSAARENQLPSNWHYLHLDNMDCDILLGQGTPASVLDVFAECGNDYQDWRIRSNVASNQNTSSTLLSRLGEDLCELVRSAVAKNKSTPLTTLETLCTDPFLDVRTNARKTLAIL